MQTKKHLKNKSKKLRGWVLSQSLFCVRIYNLRSTHSKPLPTGTDARHSQTTIQPIYSARSTHSKPRRTGTDAGYSRESLFAQPTLFWELLLRLTLNRHCFLFIAQQRNFGSRQTYGEKHRNPACGQRNFWLLFLPWKSNKLKSSCGKTPKTPPPQAIIYAPYSNTTSDQNAAFHQQAAAAPSPAAQHRSPTLRQQQPQVRSSQR